MKESIKSMLDKGRLLHSFNPCGPTNLDVS